MLNLNETIVALDLAEALRGEYGQFEVTLDPTGIQFVVATKPGRSIANLRPAQGTAPNAAPRWRIRKVGELRSELETLG